MGKSGGTWPTPPVPCRASAGEQPKPGGLLGRLLWARGQGTHSQATLRQALSSQLSILLGDLGQGKEILSQ